VQKFASVVGTACGDNVPYFFELAAKTRVDGSYFFKLTFTIYKLSATSLSPSPNMCSCVKFASYVQPFSLLL
jgi:hypothetical protein